MGSTVAEPLAAAIDAVVEVELDTLTDTDLDTELVHLLQQRHRLDAEIARRARPWHRRHIWTSDGSRSAASRLARCAKLSPRTAKRIFRRALAVEAMPATSRAWSAGELGADHVDLLATAAGSGRGSLFARDERLLVGQCDRLTFRQTTKAVQYWCQRADAELDRDDGPPPPAVSSLSFGTGFEGCVNGTFTLDPISGATVAEALRRIERDLYREDKANGVTRSMQERLAAALVEMSVRSQSAPAGGRRPEPLVCILAGEATIEHVCEMATGTVIAPDLIVPHLARADVQTFIFDGADHVVAASKSRTFRGMLRRAIQVRDRHCQHPSGCDAPIVDCDINHTVPWAHGGVTAERGGNLQCEAHNRHADLHDRAPQEVIEAARWRRETEALIRARVDQLIANRNQRPPPTAA